MIFQKGTSIWELDKYNFRYSFFIKKKEYIVKI